MRVQLNDEELREAIFGMGDQEEDTLYLVTAELTRRAGEGDEKARETLNELYGGWDE